MPQAPRIPTTTIRRGGSPVGVVLAFGVIVMAAVLLAGLFWSFGKPEVKTPDPRHETNAAAIKRIEHRLESTGDKFKVLGQESCKVTKAMLGFSQTDPELFSRYAWLDATYKALYVDAKSNKVPSSLDQMQLKLGCGGAG